MTPTTINTSPPSAGPRLIRSELLDHLRTQGVSVVVRTVEGEEHQRLLVEILISAARTYLGSPSIDALAAMQEIVDVLAECHAITEQELQERIGEIQEMYGDYDAPAFALISEERA
ncbi:hypothetical protein ACIBG4_40860 [Nonomuraea sp. NPDC050383]|uniref:hypothetical protein n=1 Tax=Nonomuraea sp. NPDC050383 TaxID=3364362 RepID=UPI003788F664